MILERLRAGPTVGGVRMAAIGGGLEDAFHRAFRELTEYCISPVLQEGGVYRGTWLESTGSISAEVLSRFLPSVARDTFLLFAGYDGLLPYKVTDAGPAFRQIQMVTPLARSVWHHYLLTGADRSFLRFMYDALARNDNWLVRHRDTRSTGCVEAFCAFDTGHDNSPRFWHIPDTTFEEDPARYDRGNPLLPLLAPDLTANVACQRRYLALIAAELGEDPAPWEHAAALSETALFEHCYDETDGMFYDRDANGNLIRVQSDVLLRVLACEVGDGAFFESALRRYLLNSRKFFARFPFTSLALDDPRFDHDFTRNSWGGPANFLSLLRAPHAFEHHGRFVELTWAQMPVLTAVCRMTRFPQTYSPWTGEQGYTERYSPAMLWTIDTVERLCGILPRPDGEIWFTGLLPQGVCAIAYARTIDGTDYESVTTRDGVIVYRDRQELARFPCGWRMTTAPGGQILTVVGMSARPATGTLVAQGISIEMTVAGNEHVDLRTGARTAIGLVPATNK